MSSRYRDNWTKFPLDKFYPSNQKLPLEGASIYNNIHCDCHFEVADDCANYAMLFEASFTLKDDNSVYISSVGTRDRGTGVGLCQFMLKTLINYYHSKYGRKVFYLHVSGDNERALHTYQKVGFKIVETKVTHCVAHDYAVHFMRLDFDETFI